MNMDCKYIPTYEISNEMLLLVSEIMENLGKLSNVNELEKLPRLRRINRLKSIHSSLVIENNNLSIEQASDVINGKIVLAPKKDIQEIKNVYEAYEEIKDINPYQIGDLLKIHAIMMKGLIKEAGHFRSGQGGVYDTDGKAVHLAPPSELVQSQIEQLLDWVKNSSLNMLIKSSIFHYEFEFIHPFNDGNGRTGRLWQTALLASWRPIFAWIPIESIIKDNQGDYYMAIALSNKKGNSNAFIEFMLNVINEAVKDLMIDTKNHCNHISNEITKLMKIIENYPQSSAELMKKLNLKSRVGFIKNYLQPALDAGLIEMNEPDKPRSKNQKYFKKI